jgi:NADPH:quinone reductase-like Zn-dependent oxidoreductase
MKAIVFTQYGPQGGLELKEVPKPAPKDDELLIRVHASSVNSWDWEYLNGKPFINRLMFGLLKPKPGKQRLGADIAGTVEAVGSRVTRFQPGDEVFGDLWSNWGGFADYACAHETALQPKPENFTFEEAAAVPQAGVLALQGIRKAGQLEPGNKVLINGAGGGVGTFAIQLAKLSGVEVTGVDASHKLDVVRSVGADHVIDYRQEDFAKSGHRYDWILDIAATRSMFAVRRALKPNGTYLSIPDSVGQALQAFIVGPLVSLAGSRTLGMSAWSPFNAKDVATLTHLIESGELKPAIDKRYALTEVAEALRYQQSGDARGKLVITM